MHYLKLKLINKNGHKQSQCQTNCIARLNYIWASLIFRLLVFSEEGFAALYKGISPALLRQVGKLIIEISKRLSLGKLQK